MHDQPLYFWQSDWHYCIWVTPPEGALERSSGGRTHA